MLVVGGSRVPSGMLAGGVLRCYSTTEMGWSMTSR